VKNILINKGQFAKNVIIHTVWQTTIV